MIVASEISQVLFLGTKAVVLGVIPHLAIGLGLFSLIIVFISVLLFYIHKIHYIVNTKFTEVWTENSKGIGPDSLK